MCRSLVTFFWCAHIKRQTWLCNKAKKPGVLSRIFLSDSSFKPCKYEKRELLNYEGLCPECRDRQARQAHRALTAPTARQPRQPPPESMQVAMEEARRAAIGYGWVPENFNSDVIRTAVADGHDVPRAPVRSHTLSGRQQPLEDLSLLSGSGYLEAQAQHQPQPLSYRPQPEAPTLSRQHPSLREQYRVSPPAHSPSPVSELGTLEVIERYSPVSDL